MNKEKYGVVIYKDTTNFGDDIQTYAAKRFLPNVDYYIDREALDSFVSDELEAVKVIFNGWFMHNPVAWPPSVFIHPLLLGCHFKVAMERAGAFDGAGVDFLRKFGSVGARDTGTLELLEKNNIDSYFSGCLTLTLKSFPNVEKTNEILLVDPLLKTHAAPLGDILSETENLRNLLQEHTDFPIKILSHKSSHPLSHFGNEERMEHVEQRLKQYQAARLVITARLHCALPCLALGTPVLLMENTQTSRIGTYQPFFKTYTEQEIISAPKSIFLPPPSPCSEWEVLRDDLEKKCLSFVTVTGTQTSAPTVRKMAYEYAMRLERIHNITTSKRSKQEGVILPIVMAFDESYAIQTYVAIYSILSKKNKKTFCKFYLMMPRELDEPMKEKFNELFVGKRDASVEYLIMGNRFASSPLKIHRITTPTYYRFAIAGMLPQHKKCIYLDSDIVVCSDLTELFNHELSNNYLAGVKSSAHHTRNEEKTADYLQKSGLESMDNYINAGVLLMNLQLIREDRIEERFAEASLKEYPTQDQTILNVICYDRILHLPFKYNITALRMTEQKRLKIVFSKDELREAKRSPSIIHYGGKYKPWDDVSTSLSHYWWASALQSPQSKFIWEKYGVNISKNDTKKLSKEKDKPEKSSNKRKERTLLGRIKNFFKRFLPLPARWAIQHDEANKERLFVLQNDFANLQQVFAASNKRQSEIVSFLKKQNKQNKNIATQLADLNKTEFEIVETITKTNNKINKVEKTIARVFQNVKILSRVHDMEYYKSLDEREYRRELEQWYESKTGKRLNLDNPQTFNEKINWMKLYDSSDIKTRLADKYAVREWVRDKIGKQYLIPLLGVWDNFSRIDFDLLPGKFVLKCTHGCKFNVLVDDKNLMDYVETKSKFDRWLDINMAYYWGLELHYKDIPPRIIAEEYMTTDGCELRDYKIWCFNGAPKYIQFIKGRATAPEMGFYDTEWNLQEFVYKYPKIVHEAERPVRLEEMLRLSETLSEGFPFVRVDFYVLTDGSIKFGEMTFTPASGVADWNPPKFDLVLGQLCDLDNSREG